MTSSERLRLYSVSTAGRRTEQLWTELGQLMGYTDTAAKRRAIVRAASDRLDFTTPYAYWRLKELHVAAVATAALAGAQLRRAALTDVSGHPGWTLLVLDELSGVRHILLDLGHEAVHVLRQHPYST
jgi:hypothetical protein